MTLVLVMLGAGVGASCRWLLDQAIQRRTHSRFPAGTLTINVLGSLAFGVLLGADPVDPVIALAGTGFCGGFTTYSTFGYETISLAGSNAARSAGLYVAASVILGVAAAALGWWLATPLR